MWTFLLILLCAYLVATSIMWTVVATYNLFHKDEVLWDDNQLWAYQQLFNYYMLSDNPVLREQTRAFLKEVGYPDEEMWADGVERIQTLEG